MAGTGHAETSVRSRSLKTLYWLQCGSCSGDTMSLLQIEDPNLAEAIQRLGLTILWQPSLSTGGHREHRRLLDAILSGRQPLDILCIEGAIIRGPGGTGMFDTFGGVPKKDLVSRLAKRAQVVVAVGTCASYGGIPASGEVEAVGVQFDRAKEGGFLGEWFTSRNGLPVINLPGCPCDPVVLVDALAALCSHRAPPLDELHRPSEWYKILVHQGCTRNEYHEFRVEEEDFGAPGCMFFHLGCLGPLTYGPCNKELWAGKGSHTRAGVPCFGCKRPDFPRSFPLFETRNLEGIPLDLPDGMDRAHFLAYKAMAAAAAPKRLKDRNTQV